MSGRLTLINFTKNRQQATVRIGIADFSPGQDNKKGKIKQKMEFQTLIFYIWLKYSKKEREKKREKHHQMSDKLA